MHLLKNLVLQKKKILKKYTIFTEASINVIRPLYGRVTHVRLFTPLIECIYLYLLYFIHLNILFIKNNN